MMMIGDGMLALVGPRRHSALWLRGSPRRERALTFFVERPQLTRVVAGVEIAAGVLLAARQWPAR